MDIQLTDGQKKAYESIHRCMGNWHGKPRVHVITGFAGTGKTTLLRAFEQELPEHPVVLTPTGKAALRVFEATGIQASTIHRYIYKHVPTDRGEFIRTQKPADEIDVSPCGVVFVDEASMVSLELWEHLFEACVLTQQNIVCLGDPFQLPPVAERGAEYFSIVDPVFVCTERVELTEIVRQALDNPIIRASMCMRQGDMMEAFLELDMVNPDKMVSKAVDVYKRNGAVICHMNATRNILNNDIRKILGKGDELEVGEPLLITKNNYNTELFNGEIVNFGGWMQTPDKERYLDKFGENGWYDVRIGTAKLDKGIGNPTLCVEEIFGKLDSSLAGSVAYNAGRQYGKGMHQHANLGYALTCHKSQGSEWPEVFVVVEPTINLNTKMGARWMYTAITRTKETLSVCMKGWR
jgi:exodeoxyribonuclease-5